MSTLPFARTEDQPPLLRFEDTVFEDKVASEQTGRVEYMDVVKVYVRAPGDMKNEYVDTAMQTAYDVTEQEVDVPKEIVHHVLNKETGETEEQVSKMMVREKRPLYTKTVVYPWLDKLKERLRNKQISDNYYEMCKGAFDRHIANKTQPVNGTPLKEWAGINEATKKKAIEMGIVTVEMLAELNEEGLTALGMGSRSAKDKAAAWLAVDRSGDAAATKLVNLQETNEDLKAQVETMAAQLSALEAKQEEIKTRGRKKATA